MQRQVLLLCATPQECCRLLPEGAQPRPLGGRSSYALGPATVMVCGVGRVNAAQAATAAIEAGGIGAVVSFGSAGAYPAAGLGIGDLAVAREEIGDELIVLPERYATLAEMCVPLPAEEPPMLNRMGADPTLSSRLTAACFEVAGPQVRVASGAMLTVSRITSSRAEAERLVALFGPLLCENMEGAAAAQVARHYGLPFAEVRAVSNLVDDRARQCWDFPLAAASCCRAVAAFVDGLRDNPL